MYAVLLLWYHKCRYSTHTQNNQQADGAQPDPTQTENSLTVPNFILVFGDIMDELNGDNVLEEVKGLSGLFAITGAVAFASGFLMVRTKKTLTARINFVYSR